MSVSLIQDGVDMDATPERLATMLEPRIPVLEIALEGYIHQKNFLRGSGKPKHAAPNQPLPSAKGKGKGKTANGKGRGRGKGKGTPARTPSVASYANSAARSARHRPANLSQCTRVRNVRQRQNDTQQHEQQNNGRMEWATHDLMQEFDQAWEAG